jgi:hypothetical protein
MACFTDLDYRNKSYPLLLAFYTYLPPGSDQTPVSYGCFDAMSDASKLYQFYSILAITNRNTPITENCFVQKTEDQQLFILNQALLAVLLTFYTYVPPA